MTGDGEVCLLRLADALQYDAKKKEYEMFYTVIKIEEDLDFGCEERQENQPLRAVVSMAGDDGEVITVKMADALLYERKIEPGTEVTIGKDGLLNKR